MLVHPKYADHCLLTPADLNGPPLPAEVRRYEGALRTIVEWARGYLCHPHPDLGRRGPVCPYAETSLFKDTFLMTAHDVPASPSAIAELLVRYRDWFAELEPRTGPAAQFKAILVLFPELDSPAGRAVIDEAQRALKPEYVARGLMVGEFHSGPPDKPGLWDAQFRPLRSPVPLLAIRHMVATDLPFLRDDARHVAAYLSLFGARVPPHLRMLVDEFEGTS
jgi:hypothetical protein